MNQMVKTPAADDAPPAPNVQAADNASLTVNDQEAAGVPKGI
jgi:hypothetical protein